MDSINSLLGRVIHGDCVPVMQKMPGASVDLVIADPPYLVNYTPRDGRKVLNDRANEWLKPSFAEAYRLLKRNRYCVSFYGWPQVDRFMSAWKSIGFRPVSHLAFVKQYSSKEGHTRSHHETGYLLVKGTPPKPENPVPDVFEWHYTGNKLHTTQKPLGVIAALIRAFSQPQGIVLDPFAGSGTTGVAAKQNDRQFILIENVWANCQIIETRLQKA